MDKALDRINDFEKTEIKAHSSECIFNIQGDLKCRLDHSDVIQEKLYPHITVSVCGFIEIYVKSNGDCYKSKKLKIHQTKDISIIIPPNSKLKSEISNFRIIPSSHSNKKAPIKLLFCCNTFVIQNNDCMSKCSVLVSNYEIILNDIKFEKIPNMDIVPIEFMIASNMLEPECNIQDEVHDYFEATNGRRPKCNCQVACTCSPSGDIEPTQKSYLTQMQDSKFIQKDRSKKGIKHVSKKKILQYMKSIKEDEFTQKIKPVPDNESAQEIDLIHEDEPEQNNHLIQEEDSSEGIYLIEEESSQEIDLFEEESSSQEIDLFEEESSSQEIDLFEEEESGQEIDLFKEEESGQEIDLFEEEESGTEIDLFEEEESGQEIDLFEEEESGQEIDLFKEEESGQEIDLFEEDEPATEIDLFEEDELESEIMLVEEDELESEIELVEEDELETEIDLFEEDELEPGVDLVEEDESGPEVEPVEEAEIEIDPIQEEPESNELALEIEMVDLTETNDPNKRNDLRLNKLNHLIRKNYPQIQDYLINADAILVSSGDIGQLVDDLETVHFDKVWFKEERQNDFQYDYAGKLKVHEPGDYHISYYVLSDELAHFSVNANDNLISPSSYYSGTGNGYHIDSGEIAINVHNVPTDLHLINITNDAVILSPNEESIALLIIKRVN
ncbi:hypothetical protein KHA93_22440 [Bacillus sp. FJAT-49732]|uniref:Uncharacterized protein n=1 Tax=Lederbergia citrisecunda TaxID=2833583 RepID=A0A942TVA0_9BACI|nr:hypothetical protein [Lederbergia citrisecunda]MBS4202364.1 hypothetical protein [Lederbergia citrisecunda]